MGQAQLIARNSFAELATWVMVAATLLVALSAIWLPPMLPCADLPGHLLAVHVHLEPQRFEGLLVPNTPPTAVGFIAPTVLLGRLFSVDIASRLTLSCYLAFSCLGFYGVARSVGGSRPLGVLAGFFACIGWSWAMGFVNYVAGISLGALIVAVWLNSSTIRWRQVSVALLWVICSVFHIPAAAVMASWGLWVFWSRFGVAAALRTSWVMVPMITHIAVAQYLHSNSIPADLIEHHGQWDWLPWSERAAALGTLSVDAWSPLAAWVVCVAALLSVGGAVRSSTTPETPETAGTALVARRRLLWGMMLGIVTFLLLPLSITQWSYLSPRVLPPIMVTGLLVFPHTTVNWRKIGLAMSVAGLCSASLTTRGVHREGSRLDAMVDVQAMPPPGIMYRAVVGVDSPHRLPRFVVPARGLGAYALASGGSAPGIWANFRGKVAILYMPDSRNRFPSTAPFWEITVACSASPDCGRPIAAADAIARDAVSWESLFLAGASAEMTDRIAMRGYRQVHANLWRPSPVQLRVKIIDPGADVVGALKIALVWPETGTRIAQGTMPDAQRSQRRAEVAVDWQVPAGPALCLAFIDGDGNGVPDPGEWMWEPLELNLRAGETYEVMFEEPATRHP